MGKADVKIDSWEPSEEHKFKYPKKKKEIPDEETLMEAFKIGFEDEYRISPKDL